MMLFKKKVKSMGATKKGINFPLKNYRNIWNNNFKYLFKIKFMSK